MIWGVNRVFGDLEIVRVYGKNLEGFLKCRWLMGVLRVLS